MFPQNTCNNFYSYSDLSLDEIIIGKISLNSKNVGSGFSSKAGGCSMDDKILAARSTSTSATSTLSVEIS